ncbi:MAG: permease-like cell division protein FtsX [Bacillota bacterium]|nr:permease-like cell division protein FtsX [Bacillota bacterium]
MIGKNVSCFSREAGLSLSRNRLLSIATTSTVAICIFILGAALLMTINAGNFMKQLESDLEIIVFVDTECDADDTSCLGEKIQEMDQVGSVYFVSKEDALKKLQQRFNEDDYNLAETVGGNPLPDSFEVKTNDPEQVKAVAQEIEKLAGVSKVNYGQGMIDHLLQVTKWVRIISIAIIVLLALGGVFLIATTIRLAIFARRKEIYLMKLIGATDWFVRWPFFIEGVILGSVGALIALLFLIIGYGSLLNNLETAIFFIPLIHEKTLLINIYVSLLLTGAALGVIGTAISVNRFLDV